MPTDLNEALQQRHAAGLYRTRTVSAGPQSTQISIEGKSYLAFCSNDYLALANDPELLAAAAQGLTRYGVGAGASHLINGHHQAHHDLEEALADFTGFPRALLFSTGYMANMAIATALLGRHDAIFADRFNHASLNDAALLSQARLLRYPHLDLGHLENQLARTQANRKLVMTDAVFSMDGDCALIDDLLALCQRFGAWLLIDDAHGFGVLGEQGRGSLFQTHSPTNHAPHLIYMATLGKAAGVAGAFVAAQEDIIETLIQQGRTYGYTTASPPLLAHTLLTSLQIIAQQSWRQAALARLIEQLRQELSSLPWQLLPSVTPIQPLLVGDAQKTVQLSLALRERGIWVPAIRPPTVPKGTARLRITLSARHTQAEIDQLALALRDLAYSS
ncbi:MAG: 8-amino-7-oxononanoate synthase [Nitrosomonas sp.]|nr:8-amino-7-oxononanoate synthase [Nitrosomonas sp.]